MGTCIARPECRHLLLAHLLACDASDALEGSAKFARIQQAIHAFPFLSQEWGRISIYFQYWHDNRLYTAFRFTEIV